MKQPFWAPALARVWRLLALAGAAWLLHSAPNRPAPSLSLEDARAFFPTATQLVARADGALAAQDGAGESASVSRPVATAIRRWLSRACSIQPSTRSVLVAAAAETEPKGFQSGKRFNQA